MATGRSPPGSSAAGPRLRGSAIRAARFRHFRRRNETAPEPRRPANARDAGGLGVRRPAAPLFAPDGLGRLFLRVRQVLFVRALEVLDLPVVEVPRSEEHTSELQSRQYL